MTHPVRNLFAYILMSAGVFLATAGGLCTLGFLAGGFKELRFPPTGENLGMIALCLFVGAIPVSMGVGLFVAGRSLRKPAGG